MLILTDQSVLKTRLKNFGTRLLEQRDDCGMECGFKERSNTFPGFNIKYFEADFLHAFYTCILVHIGIKHMFHVLIEIVLI
jgi:hypothetical protein